MKLTPSKYWRIARSLDAMQEAQLGRLVLPPNLAEQVSPPGAGHGLLLSDYSEEDQTGLVRHLGLVTAAGIGYVEVEWRPVEASIWVDTDKGRTYWRQPGGFSFAPKKVAGYGLHQLFADTFEQLEIREPLAVVAGSIPAVPLGQSEARRWRRNSIAPERLHPMAVIGEPTAAPRGGFVYVLKSALGYKVGHTRSMPNRMRTFGVRLPFLYTIPLCSWFDDRYEAESNYHRLFRDKHINGEWFDLHEADIELIRARVFS